MILGMRTAVKHFICQIVRARSLYFTLPVITCRAGYRTARSLNFVFIRAFVNTYRCRRPDFTFHEAAAVSDSQLVSTLSSHLSVVHSQTCNTIDRTPFCQVRDHDEGSCTPAGIRVAVKKAWLTKRDERRWEGTMNPGGTTMTTNVGGALRLMRTRAAVSHLRSTVHQTRHSLCSLDYAL